MKTTIKNNSGKNIINIMREAGYTPEARPHRGRHLAKKNLKTAEQSFVRILQGVPYPRFHVYLNEDQRTQEVFVNLHLDQKQPSYKGASAHSGEYEGDIIEQELKRIESFFA